MAEPLVPGGLRDEIARTLQPVRPLAPSGRRVAVLLPLAGVLLVGVPLVFGLRYDAARVGTLRLWVGSGLEVGVALAMLAGALAESVPGRLPAPQRVAARVALGLSFMIVLTFVTFLASPTHVPLSREVRYFLTCFRWPFVLGLLPLGVAGLLLRRGLTTRPALAGLMAGLGAGLLADSSWRLYCEVSDPLHVLPAQAGAVVALAVTGALGGALLRTRSVPRTPSPE